ncbi:zinc ribbon domain-containing protein [Methanobrevibacter sp.]|uniref:zinc ribbon domain-containing protein n=1 Tax=Methanobrevibacter sp. TaxID=66852 RepID=UPI00388EE4DE
MVKYCENCGHELDEEVKFCPECGTENGPIKRKCPNCGATVEGAVNFCDECGCDMNSPVKTEKTNYLEKYRIPILIVAIIAIIIVTFAAASFFSDIAVGSKNIEIDKFRFSIPANFNQTSESIGEEDYGGTSQFYRNGDETIQFWIQDVESTARGNSIMSDLGGERVDRYGHTGYFQKFTDGTYVYSFVDGNKICHIFASHDYLYDKIELL